MANTEGILVVCGHPLLDIIADVDKDFLEKYQLKPNSAILAEKSHEDLVKDLVSRYKVRYVAGGSAQNTARFAQWVFGKSNPRSVKFLGTVGSDESAKIMEEKARQDGVDVLYSTIGKSLTGTCAVLVTNNGLCRSLCSFLNAAREFDLEDVEDNWRHFVNAKYLYAAGFLISTSFRATLKFARIVAEDNRKTFVFNLSAPYVCECFGDRVLQLLPFIGILIGNEADAEAFAYLMKWKTSSVKEIVKRMAIDTPSIRSERIAIVTQGKEPVLVGRRSTLDVVEYRVPSIDSGLIKDTNGAGDAFVGGFLASLALNRSLERCVNCGIYCARQVIQASGCELPEFEFAAASKEDRVEELRNNKK